MFIASLIVTRNLLVFKSEKLCPFLEFLTDMSVMRTGFQTDWSSKRHRSALHAKISIPTPSNTAVGINGFFFNIMQIGCHL